MAGTQEGDSVQEYRTDWASGAWPPRVPGTQDLGVCILFPVLDVKLLEGADLVCPPCTSWLVWCLAHTTCSDSTQGTRTWTEAEEYGELGRTESPGGRNRTWSWE